MKKNFYFPLGLIFVSLVVLHGIDAKSDVNRPCSPCEEIGCTPCDMTYDGELPDPCEASCFGKRPFKLFRGGSRLNVGGYIEGTIRVNEHGAKSYYIDGEHVSGNGDVFGGGNGSTNFNLNQLWVFVEREMDASKGFDWGARMDLCFGMDAPNMWKWHDRTLDYDWGSGDYGTAFNNLKMMFGYKKWSVDVGIIETNNGWEGNSTVDNFFMSGALVNQAMPSQHLGARANYEINDRLTLTGGWTNGFDNGGARFNDSAFVGGFSFDLNERMNVTYAMVYGSMNDHRYSNGESRYGDEFLGRGRGYSHTVDFLWNVTDRFYYMCEWVLTNYNFRPGGDKLHLRGYGINNYLVYTLNDKWEVGTRIEWFRDNGVSLEPSDYNEVSFGLNWMPFEKVKIRPEVRYDWVCGQARPFDGNTRKTQCSGGVSLFYIF